MWICCDILIAVLRLFCVWNQRDCETRACQKRTFEMPIGRMPTSIVMQQVVMQDLWTIWFKPCLWWIVNLCSYLSVCVLCDRTQLHYMFICSNKSSLIGWVLLVIMICSSYLCLLYSIYKQCTILNLLI